MQGRQLFRDWRMLLTAAPPREWHELCSRSRVVVLGCLAFVFHAAAGSVCMNTSLETGPCVAAMIRASRFETSAQNKSWNVAR
jgi:hypothetical protein